jgi:Ser/Thr protein kinase RdoA (MazF antagonist)
MIHGWLNESVDPDHLPIPIPIRALDGRTVSEMEGRSFEIAPWMPGAPALGRPPAVNRVRAAFTALARFHRRLSSHAIVRASPGLRYRVDELKGLATSGFDRLEVAFGRRQDEGLAEPARQWIFLARAALPGLLPWLCDMARLEVPVQPCLRDARPEHFLFEGDRLSGLIDYGAMGHETVAADLARLMGEWLGDSALLCQEALTAYEQIRELDPLERTLIAPFEAAADILIAGHWISWHFIEQRTFDDPGVVRDGISRGLQRLQRLTHRIKDKNLILSSHIN